MLAQRALGPRAASFLFGVVASARPSRDDGCFGAWCEVETAGGGLPQRGRVSTPFSSSAAPGYQPAAGQGGARRETGKPAGRQHVVSRGHAWSDTAPVADRCGALRQPLGLGGTDQNSCWTSHGLLFHVPVRT